MDLSPPHDGSRAAAGVMLKRLNEIEKMDNEDKSHILHVLDGFIKSVKLKNIAAL